MFLKEGDIAFVEPADTDELIFKVPPSGEFFIVVETIIGSRGRVTALIDDEIVSHHMVADIPGYHHVKSVALVKRDPGSEVTASAKFFGTYQGRPTLLVTTNSPEYQRYI